MGTTVELDKSSRAIQQMFAGVAPRYDLLNRLLSGSMDSVWRRRAAAALSPPAGSRILDLCCGTGDQALALSPATQKVIAADFCLPMLALARKKYQKLKHHPAGLAGDSLTLPFADNSFDGATAAFGLRNVADLDHALDEALRVLRPGGRVAFLEFALPKAQPLRALYQVYFRRVLPTIGRMVSPRGSAYKYLPESVAEFPQRQSFLERMESAGFVDAAWQDLTVGIVCLYTGVKGTRGARPS